MLGNIFQASGLLALGSWVLPLIEWVISRYIIPFLSFEFEFQSITTRILFWFVIIFSLIDGLDIEVQMWTQKITCFCSDCIPKCNQFCLIWGVMMHIFYFYMYTLYTHTHAQTHVCRSGLLFWHALKPKPWKKLLPCAEFLWQCILRKQLEKVLAVILGTMSATILLAEATILIGGVDLSLFSILINSAGKQELPMQVDSFLLFTILTWLYVVYVHCAYSYGVHSYILLYSSTVNVFQVLAFVPLMYMCICTYYSLFKIGMLMFYSLTPRQTSSVSLLMICS